MGPANIKQMNDNELSEESDSRLKKLSIAIEEQFRLTKVL